MHQPCQRDPTVDIQLPGGKLNVCYVVCVCRVCRVCRVRVCVVCVRHVCACVCACTFSAPCLACGCGVDAVWVVWCGMGCCAVRMLQHIAEVRTSSPALSNDDSIVYVGSSNALFALETTQGVLKVSRTLHRAGVVCQHGSGIPVCWVFQLLCVCLCVWCGWV